MFEIYKNENIEINIDFPYAVEDYVNFLFKIKVDNFYGEHNFCVSKNDLKKSLEKLNLLYSQMIGEVKISDYDSESFIRFIANRQAVSVQGQLGSEWEDNLWIFKQELDQTIIKLLIDNINKLLQI